MYLLAGIYFSRRIVFFQKMRHAKQPASHQHPYPPAPFSISKILQTRTAHRPRRHRAAAGKRQLGAHAQDHPTLGVALLSKRQFRAKKPKNPAYPVELKTLGDHLRKVRLDRGLSQPEVARILDVHSDTISHWEWNEHEPTVQYASRIIALLGYFPFSFETAPLEKQLYYARLITGKLQIEVAKEIGCDHTGLCRIEQGLRKKKRR